MDKCREEFEAYFKEHHADSFYSVDVALEMRGDDYIDFLASDLWAIWQYQQAKVEEAEAHTISVLETGEQLVQQVKELIRDKAELQKRVDAVKHLIRGLRAEFDLWMDVECPQVERQIELLEQALKGGEA